MKDFQIDNLRKRIQTYLKENNLHTTDISGYKLNNDNHRLNVCVYFKDGRRKNFPIFRYRLNKQGRLFVTSTIAIVGAVGLSGVYGSYLYKNDGDKVELSPIDEIVLEETISSTLSDNVSSYDTSETYINDISQTPITATYVNTPETSNTYQEMKSVFTEESAVTTSSEQDKQKSEKFRTIEIDGSSSSNIDAYNHVINTYYKDIEKYGNRYGIDPSLIAALIMQETGSMDYEKYQTDYSALGLGQINCNFYDNYNFHVYNFETNEYENYKCTYQKLCNNRSEQIKIIAMMLQEYNVKYKGNPSAILVSYNQGQGTVSKIIKHIYSKTDLKTKSEILNNSDPSLIYKFDTYTYGDREYYSKVITYLNFILENKAFNKDTLSLVLPDGQTYEYNVNVNIKSLKGSR